MGILHYVHPDTERWEPLSSPAVARFRWTYDTPTTMADPGTGKVRSDSATGTGSTQFAFSKTTIESIDASGTLTALAADDLIWFQQSDTAANSGHYRVTGPPIVSATWVQIPVQMLQLLGAPIAKNKEVLVEFTYAAGGGSGGVGSGMSGMYVQRTGDTMTGPLRLPSIGGNAADLVLKMTGPLKVPSIGGDTADMVLNTNVNGNGKTIWGLTTPTASDWVATKGYVDTQRDTRVAKTGDKMSGDLTMGGVAAVYWDGYDVEWYPTANTIHAVNRAVNLYRNVCYADPTLAEHGATKNYVDTHHHGSVYYCSVQRDSDFTVASGGTVNVGWETTNTDANQRAFVTSGSGITIPKGGLYIGRIVCELQGSATTGRCTIEGIVNGGGMDYGYRAAFGIANSWMRWETTLVRAFNLNDVVSAHILAHECTVTVGVARLSLSGPMESGIS